MVVGAKVCDLTEDLLWFVCGLYVGIMTSPLSASWVDQLSLLLTCTGHGVGAGVSNCAPIHSSGYEQLGPLQQVMG